jgi:CspA family cold shock protein
MSYIIVLEVLDMEKGRVKWFNNKKGHGFITGDDGKDVFVHYSAVEGDGYKTLYPGQIVEYTVVDNVYGKQSSNVTVVEEEE